MSCSLRTIKKTWLKHGKCHSIKIRVYVPFAGVKGDRGEKGDTGEKGRIGLPGQPVNFAIMQSQERKLSLSLASTSEWRVIAYGSECTIWMIEIANNTREQRNFSLIYPSLFCATFNFVQTSLKSTSDIIRACHYRRISC